MKANGYTSGYELTPEEGRRLLDAEAERYFGISGDEFAKRWEAGEYDDEDACPEAVRVAMLLPLVG